MRAILPAVAVLVALVAVGAWVVRLAINASVYEDDDEQ
jgi:hypothetical protein